MDKDYLVLKRASASRPSGDWNDDKFDVLADGVVVGRTLKVHEAPVGSPWMWRLALGQHEDRRGNDRANAVSRFGIRLAQDRGRANESVAGRR
jgi:hypothetical protein